jgi:hypothetical protein
MAFSLLRASSFASTIWIGLSALALVASTPAPALAGPTGPKTDVKVEPKSTARSQADRGYELFEAGQYAEASQAFRLAEVIFHAPTLVFAIARSESKAGHLLEARSLYKQVLAEKIAANAPPEYRGAQEASQGELAAVEARIPRLTITVNGAAGRAFVVHLDETVVAPSALQQPLEIDPGPHHLVVTPDGGAAEKRSITVAESAREVVVIDLPPPSAKPGASVGAPPVATPRRDLLKPALASLGVGVVGLGVGAVLGGITLAKASAIRSHCVDDVCPTAQQSAADSAHTTATISTVALVVGGVFAATGVTLLVLRPKAQGPSVSLGVGPGALVAQGAF